MNQSDAIWVLRCRQCGEWAEQVVITEESRNSPEIHKIVYPKDHEPNPNFTFGPTGWKFFECPIEAEPRRRKDFTHKVYEMVRAEMERRRATGGHDTKALSVSKLTEEMLRAECMPYARIVDAES